MKPIYKTILIAALMIGLAGITATGIAYAQDGGFHPREFLAELLGLTREEIRAELEAGKTLQDLAEEAGVDLEAFREEMKATHQENLQERIEQALADGEISQDQADWLLEGLEKGYLNGPFFQFGSRGMGGEGRQSSLESEGFSGKRSGKPSLDQQ